MSALIIERLGKRFGSFLALDDINLRIEPGEFTVLLGPSGCGKTTLLRAIAGLEPQDSGRIIHAGRDVSALPPAKRDYGIVFQSYALFPNLTVAENVAYGLGGGRRAREQHRQRVHDMLVLAGLPGTESKYPAQLSGGQQQRVALARALANRPALLLLDEPLSALDAIERVRLRGEIRKLQQTLGVTTLMVTHDQEEALSMADKVVVMRAGKIEQVGTPAAIYHQPANRFVAEFIGRSNVFEAKTHDGQHVQFGDQALRAGVALPAGRTLRFSLRPEAVCLLDPLDARENSLMARVVGCEFLGSFTLVILDLDRVGLPHFVAQFSGNYLAGRSIAVGQMVRIELPAEHLVPMEMAP